MLERLGFDKGAGACFFPTTGCEAVTLEITVGLLTGGGDTDLDAGGRLGGDMSLVEAELTIRTVFEPGAGVGFGADALIVDIVELADG